jgi:PAS domain-containing protein
MVPEHESEIVEAGIYTWFVSSDTLFGDTLIAALFGLSANRSVGGLPLGDYTSRIHPDDRDRVKRLIKQTTLDGQPYHAEYRVLNAFNEHKQVIALGRCFPDPHGNPFIYSGIIYSIDQLDS